MDLLAFFTLTVTGFVGCAEFGSYASYTPSYDASRNTNASTSNRACSRPSAA